MKLFILLLTLASLPCACTPQQAAALQNACNSYAAQQQALQIQRQQTLSNIRVVPEASVYQPSRPVNTYGTITTPSGRMYQYNSMSY